MKKSSRKKQGIPISHRQLAGYVGVSQTLMSMVHGEGKHYRMLPAEASAKLSALERDFILAAPSKKPGKSLLEIKASENSICQKMLDRALADTKYFAAKAIMLQSKLDEMTWTFNQNTRWLNLLDSRLEAISPGKRKEKDYLWLSYQQGLASKRLTKNGNPAQIKLQKEIEMAKAIADVNKMMGKKIKNMLS